MKPQPATPDLPASHSLQVDGQFSDDVNGGRVDEVPGIGKGEPNEPSGRMSLDEQGDCNGM